jgi:tRNA threonylcarbamoyladenosine biosynthesis protein TsaE
MCTETSSAEETRALGAALGRRLQPGDVILLHGQLGAGKTTFVQGLAAGLGVMDPVTSPTFTLVHEYRGGRIPLIHVDPYRLDSPADILDLGFDDWLEQEAALVFEWAERLGSLAPDDRVEVRLEFLPDDRRRVRLEAHGARAMELLAGVQTGGRGEGEDDSAGHHLPC